MPPAVKHHDVTTAGAKISQDQADRAGKRAADAGLAIKIDIGLQGYRDVIGGPFNAISSIGIFEHVGLRRLEQHFAKMADLLTPHGRTCQPLHKESRIGASSHDPSQNLHRT